MPFGLNVLTITVGEKNLDGLLILPLFLQRGSPIGLSPKLTFHWIVFYVFPHFFVFVNIFLGFWKISSWPWPSEPWNKVIEKHQPSHPVPKPVLPRPSLPSPGQAITKDRQPWVIASPGKSFFRPGCKGHRHKAMPLIPCPSSTTRSIKRMEWINWQVDWQMEGHKDGWTNL